MIAMAPSVFNRFSDILSTFNVVLIPKAIPMHSPASGPRSLSINDKLSYFDVISYNSKTILTRVLFFINIAEMFIAPCIPNEFFLKLPSITPNYDLA